MCLLMKCRDCNWNLFQCLRQPKFWIGVLQLRLLIRYLITAYHISAHVHVEKSIRTYIIVQMHLAFYEPLNKIWCGKWKRRHSFSYFSPLCLKILRDLSPQCFDLHSNRLIASLTNTDFHIGDEGAVELSEALKSNSSLTSFDLRCNFVLFISFSLNTDNLIAWVRDKLWE
jgi:hypothetical protein